MEVLPKSVYALILKDWLSLPEVGAFDSAVCNSQKRKSFLENGVLSANLTIPSNKRFAKQQILDWVANRGVKLVECYIGPDCVKFPLSLKKSEITALVFEFGLEVIVGNAMTEDDIASVINSCPMVSSVFINHNEVQLNSLASKLKHIDSLRKLVLRSFDHICVNGPNLFRFPEDKWTTYESIWGRCRVTAFYRIGYKRCYDDLFNLICSQFHGALMSARLYCSHPTEHCVHCNQMEQLFIGKDHPAFSQSIYKFSNGEWEFVKHARMTDPKKFIMNKK